MATLYPILPMSQHGAFSQPELIVTTTIQQIQTQ